MRRCHLPPHLKATAFCIAATNEWSLAQRDVGDARGPCKRSLRGINQPLSMVNVRRLKPVLQRCGVGMRCHWRLSIVAAK